MGIPQTDASSTQVSKQAVMARAAFHDRAAASPRTYQRLGLGPQPQSASVRTPSRSTDRLTPFRIRPRRIAGPHSSLACI
ncbi:unnamed protein product [Linum tenue]|uniref:Uncharacterized protein n=1 Tax=Linum tenue TaxID=586396 RepID=A0AAV0LDY4_9ROSI|nr:unnamed protein product [Linum tenue]